jgi:flagellar biosynthetic protein FliR
MTGFLDGLGGVDVVMRTITGAALVGARIVPLVLVSPWIGFRRVPVTLRVSVLLALTLALSPLGIAHAPSLPETLIDFAVAAIREITIGLVFAVVSSIPFFALEHSGGIIDVLRGSPSDSMASADEGPLSNLHLLLGATLFLVLGGHRLVIAALANGLEAVPVGSPLAPSDAQSLALGSARIIVQALVLGVSFAAPAITALVLLEATLGIAGRAAPMLPTFFLGMPLRAAVGIAALLASVSLLIPHLPELMHEAVQAASELVDSLRS